MCALGGGFSRNGEAMTAPTAAVALADFAGVERTELSFVAGDSVAVLRAADQGDWWYGTVPRHGGSGWFPRAFVRLDDQAAVAAAAPATAGESDPAPAAVVLATVTALFAYAAQDADELSFAEGAAIAIVDKSPDGYARGPACACC